MVRKRTEQKHYDIEIVWQKCAGVMVNEDRKMKRKLFFNESSDYKLKR